MLMPEKLVWKFAKTYIAGVDIPSVIKISKELNSKGIDITIDVLGEYITDLSEAEKTKNEYLKLLDELTKNTKNKNISIKPSALGLLLDEQKCYEYCREILIKVKDLNGFVRIDMEDSTSTDKEINLFYKLLDEFENHVGLVVQAYLFRTIGDIENFIKRYKGDYRINLRLCKGIYVEPEEITHKRKNINPNYVKLLEYMFENKIYVGIATHDKDLVYKAFDLIEKHNIPKDKFEFQMLYGVTPKLREQILKRGYNMRVYLPFGKEWYGYSIRRFKENPDVAINVIKSIFTKK